MMLFLITAGINDTPITFEYSFNRALDAVEARFDSDEILYHSVKIDEIDENGASIASWDAIEIHAALIQRGEGR